MKALKPCVLRIMALSLLLSAASSPAGFAQPARPSQNTTQADIQPMMMEILDIIGDEADEWKALRTAANARLTRYADIQERFVSPDGSFPSFGRRIVYRGAAFQCLAIAALRGQLKGKAAPAQARTVLTSVIRRTMEAPSTFDENGWLRIGLAGAQSALGKKYISAGSLYLCSTVLHPLGLPPTDPFWTSNSAPTTWKKIWAGVDVRSDSALCGELGSRRSNINAERATNYS